MKASILKTLQNLNCRVYPKDDKFNLFRNNELVGEGLTERDIVGLIKNFNKPLTKPRSICKTPRPGCPCCDFPKNIVKPLDRKRKRAQDKRAVRELIDFE